MKKILVTGGCGFIGSCLVKKLLKTNSNYVINVDALRKHSVKESLNSINKLKNYKFIKADLSYFNKINEIINKYKPELIFHLAAESHVDRSITNPVNFVRSNINGTINILETLRTNNFWRNNKKFKLINVSTDEVYGSLSKFQKSFTEKNQYLPNSPYSASKASGDLIARSYSKTYDIPIVTTNCSNNYGPWQYPEKLIPVIILSCLKNKNIPIYGDGTNVRDWLYVEDHINALIKISKSRNYGETYNIGGGQELSNLKIVKKICKLLDKKKPQTFKYESLIKFVKDRKAHDFRYSVDISKIKKKLNYEPSFKFDYGLNKTVEWYLNNTSWLYKKIK